MLSLKLHSLVGGGMAVVYLYYIARCIHPTRFWLLAIADVVGIMVMVSVASRMTFMTSSEGLGQQIHVDVNISGGSGLVLWVDIEVGPMDWYWGFGLHGFEWPPPAVLVPFPHRAFHPFKGRRLGRYL